MNAVKLALIQLFLFVSIGSEAGQVHKNPFHKYEGKEQIPAALGEAYTRLVVAMETGDTSMIAASCVTKNITITHKRRSEKNRESGDDMNLPFLKEGFDKSVVLIRKDSDNEYILRTNTSVFWFTKSKNGCWLLTKYLDQPID